MAGGAVLIVEDSPSDAMLLEAMLAEVGIESAWRRAHDLAEGLEVLEAERPACVLLDLGLPDSDGLDTLTAVSAAQPDVAVIVVTGLDDDRAGQLAVANGAQDYLVKGAITPSLLSRTMRHSIERKRIEVQLTAQAEALRRSNEELEQFAYVASHDLAEPLRTISGFLQLLAERYQGRLDHEADEFIAFTLQGVDRLRAMIDDLLVYSRASRADYAVETIDTVALAREVRELTGQPAAVTFGPSMPVVQGDRSQLRRVLQNLVSNGLKFARPGCPPRVEIEGVEHPAEWRFVVRDDGIGIPAEHQERVFRMFQRLHSQDEYPGTGIGLAVCQRIVERHGGRMWVESAEGAGTAVHFTLPRPEDPR